MTGNDCFQDKQDVPEEKKSFLFCAGGPTPSGRSGQKVNKDTCTGDSGGSLVCTDKSKNYFYSVPGFYWSLDIGYLTQWDVNLCINTEVSTSLRKNSFRSEGGNFYWETFVSFVSGFPIIWRITVKPCIKTENKCDDFVLKP